ncbi:hypothetical protein AC1031_008922 [Aphanomyces cochlioides]|nr:hypothetical protein AC1031_008922 [Aphanomyces cochlioides]
MEMDHHNLDDEMLKRLEELKVTRQRENTIKLEAVKANHEKSAPKPRRSDRIHAMQLAKGGHVALVVTYVEPKSPVEALSGPDADKWRDAMQLEVEKPHRKWHMGTC